MKWAGIILGGFVFCWYVVPFLFHAMARSDYKTLSSGIKDARIAAGSWHEDDKPFVSYTDKYARGE